MSKNGNSPYLHRVYILARGDRQSDNLTSKCKSQLCCVEMRSELRVLYLGLIMVSQEKDTVYVLPPLVLVAKFLKCCEQDLQQQAQLWERNQHPAKGTQVCGKAVRSLHIWLWMKSCGLVHYRAWFKHTLVPLKNTLVTNTWSTFNLLKALLIFFLTMQILSGFELFLSD